MLIPPTILVSIFLIQVTGRDQPGIVGRLTSALVGHDVRVLDIQQSVIHRTVNLGLLVQFQDDCTPLLKDLLFAGHELGLTLRTVPIEEDEYEAWVARHGESRHLITLFGPCLKAEHLARISGLATEFGLDISLITRLSGRPSLRNPCADSNACIELTARGTPSDADLLRKEILLAAQELNCDIAIQADNMYRRNRRMIAFDMDSTLIQAEVIDELARVHGVVDQVSKITEAAMNGELDFDQSLRQRLRLLRGLRVEKLKEVAESLVLTRGAERLIRTIKAIGYKTAILSGGFTYFGEFLQRRLGIDHVHANVLEVRNGTLTGQVVGPIVNGERKAELLREIAAHEHIHLEQVIAVGDGANDLPMLSVAGLGIAFHAKPRVKASAKQQISTTGLDGILYLIGVRDRDVPAA